MMEINENIFLAKFGPKCRLEETLKKGLLYMKNLDYYIKLEENSGKSGIGDKNEARQFEAIKINAIDKETGEIVGSNHYIPIKSIQDMKTPVYCMSWFNVFDNIVEKKDDKIVVEVKFEEKLIDDFAEGHDGIMVLIIVNPNEFIRRIRREMKKIDRDIVHSKIKYKDTNVIYIDFEAKTLEFNDMFTKERKFIHQSEYRIAPNIAVDDCFSLVIGSIEDISFLYNFKRGSKGVRFELEFSKSK